VTDTTVAWIPFRDGLNSIFKRTATVGGVIPDVTGSRRPSAVGHVGGKVAVISPSNPTSLDWELVSIVPVGKDELRSEYRGGTFEGAEDPVVIEGDTYVPDPDAPELRLGGVVYAQTGQRSYTFEIRIESRNAESRPASEHARALVDRMRLPSVHDALEALGLAFVSWDEVTSDIYDDEEGRAVSVYIARLFMNGASYAEDLPVTTIETTQTVFNVSG
jgi:hypothetical protein